VVNHLLLIKDSENPMGARATVMESLNLQ
jgi:hypothetical protein